MPHKLYQCCDSNYCKCEVSVRTGGNEKFEPPKDIGNTKINDLTNEEIDSFLKARKNQKIYDQIDELTRQINKLEKDLQ